MNSLCLLPPRGKNKEIGIRCMAYARLFTDDIEDFLTLHSDHCYKFEPFFPENLFYDLISRELLPLEVARKATTDENAFEILDKILMIEHEELAWQIHLRTEFAGSSFDTFSSHFFVPSGNFLVIDRVASVMEVTPLLMETMCPGTRYPELRAAVSVGQPGQMNVARRFLRTLPLLKGDGETWFWLLVEGLTLDAHNISKTLPYLMPDWKTALATHRTTLAASSFSYSPTQRVLMPGVSCRPPAEFEPYRDSMTVPGTCVLPQLREYQKELVERTDRGENTVVCAPTGSGKTVVGAHAALQHLRSRASQRKAARVVMIVPKVFLVDQQATLFKEYAKKEFYIAKLSGDTTETGEAQLLTLLSGDIVVLTPQILVNMLSPSVAEKCRLFVSDITLLLLDECHHTDKKNPYNVIMAAVQAAAHERPQVVGLTASLGVGDGGIVAEDQALNHVVRMCLRMSATSVTTVMRHQAELARYVKLPEDAIRRVHPTPAHERDFHQMLISAIRFAERNLFVEIDVLMRERQPNIDLTKLIRFPALERTEEFTQAVVNLDTELRKDSDGMRKWRLKRGIQFVKMYHNAMLLNDLLPASFAYDQLISEVDDLETSQRSHQPCVYYDHFAAERGRFEKAVRKEEDKEILQQLRAELSSQFRADRNSRVLIFCLRRETAQLLVKYLNECAIGSMGRAEVLTSTNAAAVNNGQSTSGQRAVIEAFKSGECKVIVCTSVAEEGLDVTACNLIIKYNMTGNVISLVQQRGRARAPNSRSVLLALDAKVYMKEYSNKHAEAIMARTVERIYLMGDEQFGVELEKERLLQMKQEAAAEKEEEKRNKNKHRELSLLCEKCNRAICSSNSLRLYHNHYVCMDSQLWSKMRVQAQKRMVIDASLMLAGTVKCPCEREVGKVVKIDGQFVPTLKAEAILFRASDGRLLQKMKKWKAVANTLLDIREGTVLEATAMNRALSSSNATLSRALENLSLL